jgi:hypothetical protein
MSAKMTTAVTIAALAVLALLPWAIKHKSDQSYMVPVAQGNQGKYNNSFLILCQWRVRNLSLTPNLVGHLLMGKGFSSKCLLK